MEYFPGISKTLARIRCMEDGLKCVENKDAFPEPLCYVPSYFVYQMNPNLLTQWPSTGVKLFREPSSKSPSETVNVYRNVGLVFTESEPVINDEGYWLKVFKILPTTSKAKKFSYNPSKYVLLQSSTNLDIPKLLLVDYKMPSTNDSVSVWKGQQFCITSWEQVVETWYGLTVGSSAISKLIVEPNDDLVACLRARPSDDWGEKHEEQLVKFLSDHPDNANRNAGTVWAYVDKIELSSYLDSQEDSVAALTDDNHNTYWESDDSQSLHFIMLHMKKGAVIEKIFINVDPLDETYMPHKVEIHAGSTKLHEVELDNSQTGDVCVFESADQYYPVIEIRVVECKEEGIDIRIRGVKITTKNFAPTDLSEQFFTDEYRLQYPLLSAVPTKNLYWRAIALKRLTTLFDSVLPYLIPKSETGTQDDLFFSLLLKSRFLFPLSKRRKTLFDTFIKETEKSKMSSAVPKLFINRRQAADNRNKVECSVFTQIFDGLRVACRSEPPLTYRFSSKIEQWWECKFIGEGVIDQGGGFRDSLCDIADELCPLGNDSSVTLPYFVKAANQFEDKCVRDVYVVNPNCCHLDAYEWIGKLMGACVRTKEKLASFVEKLKDVTEDTFYHYFGRDHNFTCNLSDGTEVELVQNGVDKKLTYLNRLEYAELLKKCRLREGEKQIEAIRNGLLKVIPWAATQLLTWQEFETLVCGNPDISVEALKKSAHYDDIDPGEKRVQFLWEALSRFSNEEKSKFLRFVTGRRRLPTPLYICPDKGDDSLTSNSLPESSTCSNTLFLPNYASVEACEEKLRYAIFNCVAIDTDMSPWDD